MLVLSINYIFCNNSICSDHLYKYFSSNRQLHVCYQLHILLYIPIKICIATHTQYPADLPKYITELGLNITMCIVIWHQMRLDPSRFDFNQSAFWGLLHVAISHVDL